MTAALKLSICIPTHNRCSLLETMLVALNTVKNLSFEAVVVNDGSTDDTEECLDSIAGRISYPLQVCHQENQGRASALKKAVMNAKGDFVMIMDDDDQILISALETVSQDIDRLPDRDEDSRPVAGLVYLANAMESDQLIGTAFPEDGFISNMIAMRADYGVEGDKKEIIRTDILQEVMYTVPSGEKRMPTSVLWARVSGQYDVVCKNKVLIRKQYLADGLSKNVTRNRMENPIGAMMGYFEIMTLPPEVYKSRYYRMRHAVNYFRFYFHLKKGSSLFYFISAGFAGWLASLQDRLKQVVLK